MLNTHYWSDMTADEFRQLDGKNTIAVLPVGAIEQHGSHLPVSVDRDIVDEVIRRTVPRLGDLPVLFLPSMPIGKSNEHLYFPGTLSFSAQTLIHIGMEIGESVARAGVGKLLFFNGHGGNVSVLDIVARDLRLEHDLITAYCSWFSLFDSSDLLDPDEYRHGLHAGESETSVMLACRKELVAKDKARNFVSSGESWAQQFDYIGPGGGAVKLGWSIDDLNLEGACGNAASASTEKGEILLERAVENFVAMLDEFNRFSIPAKGK